MPKASLIAVIGLSAFALTQSANAMSQFNEMKSAGGAPALAAQKSKQIFQTSRTAVTKTKKPNALTGSDGGVSD
jgi:hypothetical protein